MRLYPRDCSVPCLFHVIVYHGQISLLVHGYQQMNRNHELARMCVCARAHVMDGWMRTCLWWGRVRVINQIFKGVCGPKRVKNHSFENIWLKHGVLGASFWLCRWSAIAWPWPSKYRLTGYCKMQTMISKCIEQCLASVKCALNIKY